MARVAYSSMPFKCSTTLMRYLGPLFLARKNAHASILFCERRSFYGKKKKSSFAVSPVNRKEQGNSVCDATAIVWILVNFELL